MFYVFISFPGLRAKVRVPCTEKVKHQKTVKIETVIIIRTLSTFAKAPCVGRLKIATNIYLIPVSSYQGYGAVMSTCN